MTFAHLFRCLLADPGYLPDFLKAPLKQPKNLAPLELVRLYNMRTFESNEIYSFDNLSANYGASDVGGDGNVHVEEDGQLINQNQSELAEEGIELSDLSPIGKAKQKVALN